MRALYLAILSAFAVLLTGGGAWAQAADECGVNWAPRGSFTVASDLELAQQTVTRLGEVHWRETPGQSRAPLSCAGSNDPRCHVEQADPPARGFTLDGVGGDAFTLLSFDTDVPPAEEAPVEYTSGEIGDAATGFSSELIRPPSR